MAKKQPPENNSVLSGETIRDEARVAFEKIDQFDIGSLFNEDLERSRNILLGSSFISTCVILFDVNGFDLFGFSISISQSNEVIVYLFLCVLIAILSVYYWVNARTDYISKQAKQFLISNEIDAFNYKLSEAKKEIRDNEGAAKKENLESEEFSENLSSVTKVYESSIKALEYLNNSIERHKKTVQIMPMVICTVCWTAPAIALNQKYEWISIFVIGGSSIDDSDRNSNRLFGQNLLPIPACPQDANIQSFPVLSFCLC